MKRTIFILLLILFFAVYCFGQKQTDYWHFGYYTGLNFSRLQTIKDDSNRWTDGMPVSIKGPLRSMQGCFTLADAEGNLLMSTDGMRVYNKNNKLMPKGSGLKGNNAATQSGIIVPMPGNDFKYYIITVASQGRDERDGINYSIVDMTANGGLGDVVEKNIPLLNVSTDENIASVRKPNTDDYWLIHREYNTVAEKINIYVWELTSQGISKIPAKYSFEAKICISTRIGYLKFSTDATRFASPLYKSNYVLSGEFNPNTGVVSNIQCRSAASSSSVYSVEFSYFGDQLFFGDTESKKGYHITWDNLRNTAMFMTDINYPLTNVQIASDGRIYGIEKNTKSLYVIMEPDKGISSEIRKFSNYLTNKAGLGLPTFAATWFSSSTYDDNSLSKTICMNMEQEFTFEIEGSANVKNFSYTIWNFGDNMENCIVKDYNFTADNKQTHKYTYTHPGKYTITVSVYYDNNKFLNTQTMEVEVSPCVLPLNPNLNLMK